MPGQSQSQSVRTRHSRGFFSSKMETPGPLPPPRCPRGGGSLPAHKSNCEQQHAPPSMVFPGPPLAIMGLPSRGRFSYPRCGIQRPGSTPLRVRIKSAQPTPLASNSRPPPNKKKKPSRSPNQEGCDPRGKCVRVARFKRPTPGSFKIPMPTFHCLPRMEVRITPRIRRPRQHPMPCLPSQNAFRPPRTDLPVRLLQTFRQNHVRPVAFAVKNPCVPRYDASWKEFMIEHPAAPWGAYAKHRGPRSSPVKVAPRTGLKILPPLYANRSGCHAYLRIHSHPATRRRRSVLQRKLTQRNRPAGARDVPFLSLSLRTNADRI